MTSFVGRVRELALLEGAYRGRGGAFVPIYGRRRVGKTELIRRFLEGKPAAIYVAGQQIPAALQIRELLAVAAASLGAPILGRLAHSTWKDALLAIEEASSGRRKLVLALDEFPWMAEASPELPSVLQGLWDQRWRDSGKVVLLLSGSFVGFMERAVLGRKAPLFGRRTAQIFLQPFGYREAALFHPSYSRVDRARTYFVCGGVPRYLRLFDPRRSVDMNIRACFLEEHAPLFQEADFLLREELRQLETYHAILISLAQRAMSLTEIGAVVGLGSNVQYHLKQLVSLGYVARRQPVEGGGSSRRAVRYVLDDPLLRFWFRFVSPNQSFIHVPGPEATFAARVRPALDAYFGSCFERLCREALPDLYAREGVTGAYTVGEYWDRDVQIDVVGVRDDGVVDLGECKWSARASRAAIARELDDRVPRFPNRANAAVQRRVFTRAPFVGTARGGGSGTMWHTLADLYGE